MTVAERNFRFEWQFANQCSVEFCPQARLANHKSTCGTYIHNIVGAQLFREGAWSKCPVSAHIDASQENDESHISNQVQIRVD